MISFDGVFEPYPHRIETNLGGMPFAEFEYSDPSFKFLRPAGAPLDCVWCCLYFPYGHEKLNDETIRPHVYRVLYYECGGEIYWILLRRNCGLIFRKEDFPSRKNRNFQEVRGARFKQWKRGPRNLWRWLNSPQTELTRWFEEEIARPEADFHTALSWLNVPRTEKTWQMYEWELGYGAEYVSILHAILTVFYATVIPYHSPNSTLYCRFNGPVHRLASRGWHWWDSARGYRNYLHLPSTVTQLNQILHQEFQPHYVRDSRWRGVSLLGESIAPEVPWFKIEQPTEHEKLEAFLRLREWLESIGEWENIGPLLPR